MKHYIFSVKIVITSTKLIHLKKHYLNLNLNVFYGYFWKLFRSFGVHDFDSLKCLKINLKNVYRNVALVTNIFFENS